MRTSLATSVAPTLDAARGPAPADHRRARRRAVQPRRASSTSPCRSSPLDIPGQPPAMTAGNSDVDADRLPLARTAASSSTSACRCPAARMPSSSRSASAASWPRPACAAARGPYEMQRSTRCIYELRRRPLRALPDLRHLRRQAVDALHDRRAGTSWRWRRARLLPGAAGRRTASSRHLRMGRRALRAVPGRASAWGYNWLLLRGRRRAPAGLCRPRRAVAAAALERQLVRAVPDARRRQRPRLLRVRRARASAGSRSPTCIGDTLLYRWDGEPLRAAPDAERPGRPRVRMAAGRCADAAAAWCR